MTRESRGFAFVTFEDNRDAADAVKDLNGREFQGRAIRVEIARRSKPRQKTPGQYLGPQSASHKFGRDSRDSGYGRDRGYGGGRDSGYGRDRDSRDSGYGRDRDRGYDRRDDRDSGYGRDRDRSYDRRDDRGRY